MIPPVNPQKPLIGRSFTDSIIIPGLEELNATSLAPNVNMLYMNLPTPDGQLIAITSLSFLYSEGSTGTLRRKLIDEGRINTIIQLPAGLLYGSGLPVCIVIINDETQKSNAICLIDASEYSKKDRRLNILQVDELLQAIDNDDEDCVTTVPTHIIIKNNYKLLPSAYLNKESDTLINLPDGFKAVKLKDIVTVARGSKCQSDEARIVRGGDLHANGDIEYVTFDNLRPEVVCGKNLKRINEDVILLQKVRNLKPTLFSYQKSIEIVLSSNIIALKPTKAVDPYYLVSELREDYISNQVNKMVMGSVIPMLRVSDLLNINVVLPPLELQHSAFLNAQRLEREKKQKELTVDEYIQRERERINE